jgi:hypothetical protein
MKNWRSEKRGTPLKMARHINRSYPGHTKYEPGQPRFVEDSYRNIKRQEQNLGTVTNMVRDRS